MFLTQLLQQLASPSTTHWVAPLCRFRGQLGTASAAGRSPLRGFICIRGAVGTTEVDNVVIQMLCPDTRNMTLSTPPENDGFRYAFCELLINPTTLERIVCEDWEVTPTNGSQNYFAERLLEGTGFVVNSKTLPQIVFNNRDDSSVTLKLFHKDGGDPFELHFQVLDSGLSESLGICMARLIVGMDPTEMPPRGKTVLSGASQSPSAATGSSSQSQQHMDEEAARRKKIQKVADPGQVKPTSKAKQALFGKR